MPVHLVTVSPRPLSGNRPCQEEQQRYDVIIEDFAYEAPGRLRAAFWRSLRERHASRPGGRLLANTLYERREQLDELARELRRAGWRDVRQTCDRGLQAEAGEGRTPRDEGDWRPRDNMIFSARAG